MWSKKILIILTLAVICGGTVQADDLITLTIENDYQVAVVSGLVDHAVTKVDGKFVAIVTEEQHQQLQQAGIATETLQTGVDPNQLYLLRPQKPAEEDYFDITKITPTVELGAGMHVASLSGMAASEVADHPQYTVTPVEDLEIYFHYIPTAISKSLAGIEDFPTDSLADLVSYDSIYAVNTRLEAFQTRYIFTDSIDAARDWMVQKLVEYGYTVSTPTFYYGGEYHYNVMAVKQGYAEPDKVIVIGGHYDSITYGEEPGPLYYAPGADDDGSGTTITMEMARILKDIPTRKTIIFMPFSAEEVGLVGSRAAAQQFAYDGTLLEVMYNFDMVGFTQDSYWNINLQSGPVTAYVDVTFDAAQRVTALEPVIVGLSGSSDHYSFHEQGFNICYTAEGDFNTLGWHTNLDLTSRMNFDYMNNVARMTAASVGITANSAYPTTIDNIVDMGDGQSVTIYWDDACDPNYTYTVFWGPSSGNYTDSAVVPSGLCSYTVNGLIEGDVYYFSIVGDITDGYPAMYVVEESMRSLTVPRVPLYFTVEPMENQLYLSWTENLEADISHYRIYRDDGSGYTLLQDNITSTEYYDNSVSGHVSYEYKITAVDTDMNESNYSTIATGIPATFDGGILIVDESGASNPLPDQAGQIEYFNTLMSGQPYGLYTIDDRDEALNRNTCGQYSSLFWFDDDLNSKLISRSADTLDWFAGFTTNMFLSGFRTLSYWQASPIPSQHILYQEFGLSGYETNDAFDFAGAFGENGFPSVEIDTSNVLGYLPYIPKLYNLPGAQVIYRYNSISDDISFENEPCGIMVTDADGIHILISFPLYFLTDESAHNLISHVKSLFGESFVYVAGDADNSGVLEIADLLYLVDYMFNYGPAPTNLNAADVDASCSLDVSDLLYLVDYMFLEPPGAAPQEGCVY